MRILGVDPGTRLTGYGCIDQLTNKIHHVTHGTLRVLDPNAANLAPLEDRLLLIYEGLSKIIQEFKPDVLVVERVFFAKNANSALKLGQARGAILLTGKIHSLSIAEYSAKEVKRAVVGNGQADKQQVASIVQLLVGKQVFETFDASDGLALAICHAQLLQTKNKFRAADELALQFFSKKRSKKKLSLAESLGHHLRIRKK